MNKLRFFQGEVLSNPSPLEISLGACSFRCAYCFADGSGRNEVNLTIPAAPTIKHIVNVMRTGGHPTNMADQLLLRRHPITLSNGTDPSGPRNLPGTLELLPVLAELDIPVILQTRGTVKPEAFRQVLSVLPDRSVVYVSITGIPGEDEELLRVVDKGCPSNAQRCEMAAMAAEAGFPVVLAANPADMDWIPRPDDFFARCLEIAGRETFKGVWVEPMHLHRKQALVMLRKQKAATPADLPPISAGAYERATTHVLDGYWARDFWSAMTSLFDRYFSIGMPQTVRDGEARLFELWPNPFPTHHNFVAACKELSEAHGGSPVLVTFETFCSWVDPLNEVLDMTLSRADAWAFINGKNDVDQIERAHLPETFTLRECLRFLWRRPKTKVQAIFGAYGLKGLVDELRPARDEGDTEADPDDNMITPQNLREHLDGRPSEALSRCGFTEDDGSPLAVWAPQQQEWGWTADKKDRLRLADEIMSDLPVMLEPLDPDDVVAAMNEA